MTGHISIPRGRQPIFLAPHAVVWLVAGITAIHAILGLLGEDTQLWAVRHFAFVPYEFFALFGDRSADVPVQTALTLVTHAFLHGDWTHLFINMGMLLAFGSVVERTLGSLRMLIFFAATAAAGALTQALFEGGQPFMMIGASGAVYGMMGVVVRLLLMTSHPGGRRRAIVLAMMLLGLNLFAGLLGFADLLAGARVAWQAHMGGFVAGFLLTFLIPRRI